MTSLNRARVVFTCGRFNPPTVGHEALIGEVKRLAAEGREATIFATRTHDSERNPLDPATKARFLERTFALPVRLCVTPFEALGMLADEGATDITFVIGEDRAERFTAMHCAVHSIKRPPGSPSGTMAREAAAAGDMERFRRLVPAPDPAFADDLFSAVRAALT